MSSGLAGWTNITLLRRRVTFIVYYNVFFFFYVRTRDLPCSDPNHCTIIHPGCDQSHCGRDEVFTDINNVRILLYYYHIVSSWPRYAGCVFLSDARGKIDEDRQYD